MKRRTKVALVAMGLVGVMATVSFAAAEGTPTRERFLSNRGRIAPMERRMEKRNLTKEEGIELKGIDFEAKKQEMLQHKFQRIDEKVASGEMTAEEAETLKEKIQERMENFEGEKSLRKMKNHRMGKGRFNKVIESGDEI